MEDLPPNFDVLFLTYIKEQKDAVDQVVVRGQCRSHEEYLQLTGRRHGIELAELQFKKLLTQWENRQ